MGTNYSKKLWQAASDGDIAGIQNAIAAGGDMNVLTHNYTPLSIAARNGQYNAVQFLLDRNALDLPSSTSHGGSALHVAAYKNRTRVVDLLLHRGANHWQLNKKGLRAVQVAMARKHVHLVRLMEQRTCPFQAWIEVQEGYFFSSYTKRWCIVNRPLPRDSPSVNRAIKTFVMFKTQGHAKAMFSADLQTCPVHVVRGSPTGPFTLEQKIEFSIRAHGVTKQMRCDGLVFEWLMRVLSEEFGQGRGPGFTVDGRVNVPVHAQAAITGHQTTPPPVEGQVDVAEVAARAAAAVVSATADAVVSGATYVAKKANEMNQPQPAPRGEAYPSRLGAGARAYPVRVPDGAYPSGAAAAAAAASAGAAYPARAAAGAGVRAGAGAYPTASAPVADGSVPPPYAAVVGPAGYPIMSEEAQMAAAIAASRESATPAQLLSHGPAGHPIAASPRTAAPLPPTRRKLATGYGSSTPRASPTATGAGAGAPAEVNRPSALRLPELSAEVLDKAPEYYVCPITCEVMTDPVVAADGRTYERKVITEWLADHGTSPLTNEPIADHSLRANWTLRAQIQDWAQREADAAAAAPAVSATATATPVAVAPTATAVPVSLPIGVGPPPSYTELASPVATSTPGSTATDGKAPEEGHEERAPAARSASTEELQAVMSSEPPTTSASPSGSRASITSQDAPEDVPPAVGALTVGHAPAAADDIEWPEVPSLHVPSSSDEEEAAPARVPVLAD